MQACVPPPNECPHGGTFSGSVRSGSNWSASGPHTSGSVLAAWNPRAAGGLLGGLAFASYLVNELGPIFKWPSWVQDLSAFKLFGNPLASGVDRSGLAIMIAIVLVGFVGSILLMQRRDVGA